MGDLVDHSLVQHVVASPGSRYTMLETIREYAEGRLSVVDRDDAYRLLLRYLIAIAEGANLYAEAEGPQDFPRVLPEHQNVRAALDWAVERREVALGLELAVLLENFWVTRNPLEGAALVRRLLDLQPALPLRARGLRASGGSAHAAGHHTEAKELYQQSLQAFRELGDERGASVLTYRLGYLAVELGETAEARNLLEDSLRTFRDLGSVRGEAQTIGSLGSVAHAEGDLELAASLYERSAALADEIGRTWWRARMLSLRADVGLARGDPADAERWAREAIEVAQAIADRRTLVNSLSQLAAAAARTGDVRRAGLLLAVVEAEVARAPLGEPPASRLHHTAEARAVVEAAPGLRVHGGEVALEAAIEELRRDRPATRTHSD